MSSIYDTYEPVIGIEVHVQLSTQSKAYCGDATAYGASPNSQVSPISLGHPGTLPVFNKSVMNYAVKLGIACDCKIRERNEFARKNYFYADLPKGYQITQDTTPICTEGFVRIKDAQSNVKKINLTRIHMEEDSGKSVHDIDPFNTLVDLNRAGIPLLEIVSEPEIKNGEEAYSYLSEIRKLVRYLEISDGNMEEGSLRADLNISVRKKDATKFGTKVEVKNMNSFRNVQKAIDYEIIRQIDLIESGEEIHQETRTFNAAKNITIGLRSKENAHEYRYFPEPDLVPVIVPQSYVESVREIMPPLPYELFMKYTKELGLSEYDAYVLTDSKDFALYFEEVIKHSTNYKGVTNLLIGPVKSWLNEQSVEIEEFPIAPAALASIQTLVDDQKISISSATQKLFPALLEDPSADAAAVCKQNGWIQQGDNDQLQAWVDQALAAYPEKVEEYRSGKKGLIGLFMGEVMKYSRGSANPKKASALLREKLDE
ncbi:MAG TPA: Asp-tRNA(Asn)/Glu-tRNA(Gln) amidotransferase GatCAB subunit B [Cryomorphaceae bacterium]|nr:Asp-tRNA(Asn)/Glu-tRNA(Gln) amidotransferase GatCAB subunit B [Cryomorphaceae bacterium]|tara:strand:+ start:1855 stop:3309 length:1455 start_codon:yes stop_codon:yes gene_type:complete